MKCEKNIRASIKVCECSKISFSVSRIQIGCWWIRNAVGEERTSRAVDPTAQCSRVLVKGADKNINEFKTGSLVDTTRQVGKKPDFQELTTTVRGEVSMTKEMCEEETMGG